MAVELSAKIIAILSEMTYYYNEEGGVIVTCEQIAPNENFKDIVSNQGENIQVKKIDLNKLANCDGKIISLFRNDLISVVQVVNTRLVNFIKCRSKMDCDSVCSVKLLHEIRFGNVYRLQIGDMMRNIYVTSTGIYEYVADGERNVSEFLYNELIAGKMLAEETKAALEYDDIVAQFAKHYQSVFSVNVRTKLIMYLLATGNKMQVDLSAGGLLCYDLTFDLKENKFVYASGKGLLKYITCFSGMKDSESLQRECTLVLWKAIMEIHSSVKSDVPAADVDLLDLLDSVHAKFQSTSSGIMSLHLSYSGFEVDIYRFAFGEKYAYSCSAYTGDNYYSYIIGNDECSVLVSNDNVVEYLIRTALTK